MMCDHVCVRASRLSISLASVHLEHLQHLLRPKYVFLLFIYTSFSVYARTFCVYTTCSCYKILTGKADYSFRMWANLQSDANLLLPPGQLLLLTLVRL